MKKSFLSILLVFIFCSFNFGQESPKKPTTGSGIGSGRGSGQGNAGGESKSTVPNSDKVSSFRILSKPRANYTDMARQNAVEGIVRLRVTFLASGEIGSVSPVSALPYGLTEQAITAARNIKFEPAQKNGVAVSVTKLIEYSFTLYYRENDEALAQNAEILEMPDAEHPQENNFQNIGGKVKATISLGSNGTARIIEINTDSPKAFAEKAAEAVAKIKFKPAIHKNGNAVTQFKEIEYEFKKQKN